MSHFLSCSGIKDIRSVFAKAIDLKTVHIFKSIAIETPQLICSIQEFICFVQRRKQN